MKTKFEDFSLGTQAGISLERFVNHHSLVFRECGIGTYQEKSGRDAHRAWYVESKKGKVYYIYLQVAYNVDVFTRKKFSTVSSIVLFDFSTYSLVCKTHLNSYKDLSTFLNEISPVLLDD